MKDFFNKLGNVQKFLVSVVGVVLMAAAPYVDFVTTNTIFGFSAESVVSGVLAVLTAVGVYEIPNTPSEPVSDAS